MQHTLDYWIPESIYATPAVALTHFSLCSKKYDFQNATPRDVVQNLLVESICELLQ